MVAAPDEAGSKDSEVPAMFLDEPSRHPLLPPFGDGVAATGINVRRLVKWRAFIESGPGGTVVVDREAAAQHQLPAGAAGHRVQQTLGAGHSAGELRVLSSGD